MNDQELIRAIIEELKKTTPVVGGKIHAGDIRNFPPSLRRAMLLKMGKENGMGPWGRAFLDVEIGFQDAVEDNMRRNPERSRDQAVGATFLNFVATVFMIVGTLLIMGMMNAVGEMIGLGETLLPSRFPLWHSIIGGVVGFGMVVAGCVVFKKMM